MQKAIQTELVPPEGWVVATAVLPAVPLPVAGTRTGRLKAGAGKKCKVKDPAPPAARMGSAARGHSILSMSCVMRRLMWSD